MTEDAIEWCLANIQRKVSQQSREERWLVLKTEDCLLT
jgi:hypothetical protein